MGNVMIMRFHEVLGYCKQTLETIDDQQVYHLQAAIWDKLPMFTHQ